MDPHIGDFQVAERLVEVIELVAIAIIVAAVAFTLVGTVIKRIQSDKHRIYMVFRRLMTPGLLIGLDLLIAADIVSSVTLERTLESIATDGGETMHADVTYEREQFPEDVTEKDIELHVAPAVRGHMRDLLQAIDNRTRPVADIEQGYISTTSCILANIAMDLGRTLEWDPEAGQVVDDTRANELLTRPYRSPYVHPHAGRV